MALYLILSPIIANNGRMPVSKSALIKAKLYSQLSLLENNKILTHVLADDSTRLYFFIRYNPHSKTLSFSQSNKHRGGYSIEYRNILLVQFYMKDINN